jgi:hypothetical protein
MVTDDLLNLLNHTRYEYELQGAMNASTSMVWVGTSLGSAKGCGLQGVVCNVASP